MRAHKRPNKKQNNTNRTLRLVDQSRERLILNPAHQRVSTWRFVPGCPSRKWVSCWAASSTLCPFPLSTRKRRLFVFLPALHFVFLLTQISLSRRCWAKKVLKRPVICSCTSCFPRDTEESWKSPIWASSCYPRISSRVPTQNSTLYQPHGFRFPLLPFTY